MSYHLATAFVKVGTDLAGLGSGLSKAKSMVTRSLGGIAGMIAKITAAGAGLAGVGLGFAVKLGSDAQEMSSMFDAVFKEQSAGADKFANDFALKIGRSVNDVKGQMAGFQDTFVPLGFARDEAAGLSKQLAMVTADLASFKNKNDADVARTLTSALTGEREALKGLGIVIQEVDVKNELLRMGMAKATGDTLKQAKAQATLNLILRNSKDAQGDAERTAGSFSNRMRGLQGAVKDTAADIGSALLPALAAMAKKVTDVIRTVQPRIQALAKSFSSWSRAIVADWETAWQLIQNTAHLGIETLKATIAQYPKIWAWNMGRSTRIIVDALQVAVEAVSKAVAYIADNWDKMLASMLRGEMIGADAGKGFVEQFVRSIGDMPAAAKAGFDGKAFSEIFEFSQGMDKAIAKNTKLLAQLSDAKKRIDEKAATVKIQQAVDVAANVKALSIKSVEMPTGFFGFADLHKEIQASMLKSDNNEQRQLLRLTDAGNRIQHQMLDRLDKIAKQSPAAAVPGAR